MDKLCQYLTTYYDTNILSYNPRFKKIFLNILKNAKQSGKTNNTLLTLLMNNNIPKIIAYEVNGPFTLSLHTSREYNMNVYVFGEIHSMIKDKPVNLISDYLYDIMRASNVFIDFFVEYFKPLDVNKIYKVNAMYLDKLRIKVEPCIRQHSSCLILNSSRTHYLDIRDLDNTENLMLNYMELYKYFVHDNRPFGKGKRDYKSLMLLTRLTKNNIVEYMKHNFIELRRLNKEMSKTDRVISNMLKRYMKSNESTLPEWTQLTKYDINYVFGKEKTAYADKKFATIMSTIEHIVNITVYISVFLTDYYTIARLFKTFDVAKGVNQPKKAHNVIMYAGNSHSKNYRNIFKRLQFDQKYIIHNENTNTSLNLPENIQPLFSFNSGVITNFEKN